MQNCQRCHSKEAIIICMQCESFKYLCEKCDNYIHNLPGKKSHNRISLNAERDNQNKINKFQNNNSNENINQTNKNQNDNNINQKQINQISNSNDDNLNNNNDNIIMNSNTDIAQQKNNISRNNIQKINSDKDIISNNVFDKINNYTNENKDNNNFSYSTLYSKNYLNELQSTYNKDKIDLQCNGSTIKTSFEKFKFNIIEQLKVINNQIENFELIQSNLANSIETKYKNRINDIINDKDNIILDLKEQNENLRIQNEQLNNQMGNLIEENRIKILEYEKQIKLLEDSVLKKEEQIFILKTQLDNLVITNKKNLQNETNRISIEYEKKIHNILNETDNSKEKLVKVINDRENDIRNLVETNKYQNEDLIQTVQKLKKQNEYINNQLEVSLAEKEILQRNFNLISQEQNKFIQEKQNNENSFSKILNENRRLSDENKELNLKVKKLENLVYGKMKK
jgi:hypothetical protein